MARLLSRLGVLAALAALATVTSACSATPATPPGSGSAAPSSSAGPTTTPLATLAVASVPPASALPSNLFPCDLSASSFIVSLHTPHGIVDARGLAAPEASAAASASAAPATVANAGELVGAQSYTADFALDFGGYQQPVAPTAIQASVALPGTAQQATIDLHATSAGITIPDGKGAATLTLLLTIANDPCPDLLATVHVAFRLVPAATAAACPTGQPGYAQLIADLDPRLTVGGVTRQLAIDALAARYVNVAGADQVPPFAGYNPTAPAATADRGHAITITSAAKGITVTAATVQVWRRSDVVGADGKVDATGAGEPLATEQLKGSGGIVSWAGPGTAGNYVIGVFPRWSQACMTGTGYVFLSLTVS
jgi:hypothetical protein